MLLQRLGLPFECVSPSLDESPLPGEDGEALALRLAEAKAEKVAESRPDGLIIGSDQVGLLEDRILGKPGGHAAAREQLMAASGKCMRFVSAVCLLDARSGRRQLAQAVTRVNFLPLELATVEAYLRRDEPYDCAGAFRSESLAVALIESMESDDPTAILGMPLIRLTRMLAAEDVHVLGS
jgi:septum formation protein